MSARNCSEMQLVANSAKQICLMETKDVNLQVNPNCICHFNISYRLRLLHFKLDKPVSIQTIKHEATRACTQLDTKDRKTELSACFFFTICYSILRLSLTGYTSPTKRTMNSSWDGGRRWQWAEECL